MQEKPVVLLLAGGKSTRFWPLSEKNTYKFLGKSLVEHQIETLKRLGLKDLIVVASEKVFDWLVENSQRFSDLNINYIRQHEDLAGMAGAVLSARENFQTHFQGRSLYILNCNDLCEDRLHYDILDKFEKQEADVLVCGYKVDKYQPLGYWVLEDNKVTGLVEKPGADKMPSQFAKIVADLFVEPSLFLEELERLSHEDKGADDLYEQAFEKMFSEQKVEVVEYGGRWEILKYPWHVLSVTEFYLSQITSTLIDPSAQVSEKAEIGEKVIISEGVKIFAGAKISGHAYIGKNTVIGDGSLVRQSVVGADCVIGFGSEITRSYLGDSIWLHMNYIGDSILERNVSLGAGTVTGNFRLDEKNIFSSVKGKKIDVQINKLGMIVGQGVRFGVNASIMPGIKIGGGSFVGPGVVLNQDLENKSFCAVKQEMVIKKNKVKIKERKEFHA